MKERLEFREGDGGKFWEIAVDGANVTVTFGKLGTAGQGKTKDLGSDRAAEESAAKQIADKLKKGYQRAGAPVVATPQPAAPAAPDGASLPAALAAMIGSSCFIKNADDENDVVVFDWASFDTAAQAEFLDPLFDDCSSGDFAELIELAANTSWKATHCIPFALYGVVSGGETFCGGAPPQFDRLLLLDRNGNVSGIDIDGTAIPAREPQLIAKSWSALKIKVRAKEQPAGVLPAWKPTRHARLVSSAGEFRAASRQVPSVQTVATSADGSRVALNTHFTGEDPARVYSLETGALLRSIGPSSRGVALSPDGRTLITVTSDWRVGPDTFISAWNVETGEPCWRAAAHGGGLYSFVHLAVSPDGATLVSSSDGPTPSLRAWSLKDGTEVWSGAIGADDVYAGALAVSPDGKWLAAGCSNETVQIWDMQTGTRVHEIPHPGTPRGICWTTDGTRIVTSSSSLVAIWVPGEVKPAVVLAEKDRDLMGGAVVALSNGLLAGRVDWTQIDLWTLDGTRLERLDLKKKIGVATLAACPGGIVVGTSADCALRFQITP